MTVEYEPDSPTSICSIPTKFESESLTSRLTFSSITGLAIPEMNIASLFWYVCFPAVTETLVIISAGAIIIDFTVTMNAVAIWFSELSFAKHVTVVEPIGKKLPEWGLHFGAIDNFKSRISASFTKKLGSKTIILGKKGEIHIENTWLNPSTIKVKSDQNKIINFESSASIFSHEIDALSKCILDDKLKPNFPDLTINDIIGNMKIIDKWKN